MRQDAFGHIMMRSDAKVTLATYHWNVFLR